MQKIHQLGHAFEAVGMIMVGGSGTGYLATDQLPPGSAGYIMGAGVLFFLLGKFLLVYTGEHFGETLTNGNVKIDVKQPTTSTTNTNETKVQP